MNHRPARSVERLHEALPNRLAYAQGLDSGVVREGESDPVLGPSDVCEVVQELLPSGR